MMKIINFELKLNFTNRVTPLFNQRKQFHKTVVASLRKTRRNKWRSSPPRLSYTDENANDNFFFALCGLLAGFFKRHSPKDSKNRGSFGRKTRALQRPAHRGLVPDFLKYRKTKCVSLSLWKTWNNWAGRDARTNKSFQIIRNWLSSKKNGQ